MNLNEEYKNELIRKYRTELFETDNVNLAEIDGLISDEDLKTMFQLNNSEICELINKKPLDKETVRKLLIANVNLYKLSKRRHITVNGISLLLVIGNTVNYNIDKLYAELNVGVYNRPYKRR